MPVDTDTTLGPDVLLVRETWDGETVRTWMPVVLALMTMADDPDNGTMWAGAWIYTDNETPNLGAWDRSA